jgi:putative Mg2+ transporter-C (MgtC) family protein
MLPTTLLNPSEPMQLIPYVAMKFVFAAVLSGAIGLERERKGRAAGLRTHVLVCLGSTLAMVVSDLLAAQWNSSGANVWLDRGRIAAGVLTGIGFLGAGTIINVNGLQRGLTTAAMIWFVATLGIAVGVGMYVTSTLATLFVLLVVVGLETVENRLPSAERYTLTLEMPDGLRLIDDVVHRIRQERFIVTPARIRTTDRGAHFELAFEIATRYHKYPNHLVAVLLETFPSIHRIEVKR